MNKPHGYTLLDLMTACALFLVSAAVIVLIMNPRAELAQQKDELRIEGVRDLTEVIMEMRAEDPVGFERLLGELGPERVMIGAAESCAGSYGSECSEAVLRDECLNLDHVGLANENVIDPDKNVFNEEVTGYYLSLTDGILEVGACNPESRANIRVEVDVK